MVFNSLFVVNLSHVTMTPLFHIRWKTNWLKNRLPALLFGKGFSSKNKGEVVRDRFKEISYNYDYGILVKPN